MNSTSISSGTVHTVPTDLRKALLSSSAALETWQSLTPLARNEWICWTISVKQKDTRKVHVKRVISELQEGKRRPCCWIGCIHRQDKELSPSIKGIISKRDKTKK